MTLRHDTSSRTIRSQSHDKSRPSIAEHCSPMVSCTTTSARRIRRHSAQRVWSHGQSSVINSRAREGMPRSDLQICESYHFPIRQPFLADAVKILVPEPAASRSSDTSQNTALTRRKMALRGGYGGFANVPVVVPRRGRSCFNLITEYGSRFLSALYVPSTRADLWQLQAPSGCAHDLYLLVDQDTI